METDWEIVATFSALAAVAGYAIFSAVEKGITRFIQSRRKPAELDITTPEHRSCYSCTGRITLEGNTRCRPMLRDEVNMGERQFQTTWGWQDDLPDTHPSTLGKKCPYWVQT